MPSNLMKSLAIIRSQSLSPNRIRECAERLEHGYSHLRFKWAQPEPDEGRVPDFIVDQLFDVRNFGIVYAVDVWFHASSFLENSKIETIRRIFDADQRVHWRELWRTYEQNQSADRASIDTCQYELSIGCGKSHLGYYCCFDPLDHSPAFKDKRYRKELFQRAISTIGLQDKIRVSIDEHDDLRMTADPPWRLTHFIVQANGANPVGFNVNGFKTSEQANEAALAMLRGLSTMIGTGMIRVNLSMPTYEKAFPRLNQIARGWRIQVTSEWNGPAARSLHDQESLDEGNPGRYPAFNWWEDTNGPEVIGNVLAENGNCFLELASEGGSVEQLKERASVLENVKFHTVFP